MTAPKSKPRRTRATKDIGSGVRTVGKFFGIQNNSNIIFPQTTNLMEMVLSDQSTSIQYPGATAVPTNKQPIYADKAKAKPSVSPEEVSSTVQVMTNHTANAENISESFWKIFLPKNKVKTSHKLVGKYKSDLAISNRYILLSDQTVGGGGSDGGDFCNGNEHCDLKSKPKGSKIEHEVNRIKTKLIDNHPVASHASKSAPSGKIKKRNQAFSAAAFALALFSTGVTPSVSGNTSKIYISNLKKQKHISSANGKCWLKKLKRKWANDSSFKEEVKQELSKLEKKQLNSGGSEVEVPLMQHDSGAESAEVNGLPALDTATNDEGARTVTAADGEGARTVTGSDGEGARTVTAADGEGARTVTAADGEGSRTVTGSDGEGARTVARTVTAADGEGARTVTAADGEGASGVTGSDGEGARTVTAADGEGARTVTAADGEGARIVTAADGEGARTVTAADGEGSRTVTAADGEGARTVTGSDGEGARIVTAADGEGSRTVTAADGEGARTVTGSDGEGARIVTAADGEGARTVTAADGEGARTVTGSDGEGARTVTAADGEGASGVTAADGEGARTVTGSDGEGASGVTAADGDRDTSSDRDAEFYCVCKKPDDGELYVFCQTCLMWLHPKCVFGANDLALTLTQNQWLKRNCVCNDKKHFSVNNYKQVLYHNVNGDEVTSRNNSSWNKEVQNIRNDQRGNWRATFESKKK